jgi:tetrahydromethanopterin S-methyltransferase subunit F
MLIIYNIKSLTSIALKSALVLGFKAGFLFSLFLVKVLLREAAFLLANLIVKGA